MYIDNLIIYLALSKIFKLIAFINILAQNNNFIKFITFTKKYSKSKI